MSDTMDLTGDGGVVKTVIGRAKADAVAPSDILPLVDGITPHLQQLPLQSTAVP